MHDHLNVTTRGSTSFSFQCYWILRTSHICICRFAKTRQHRSRGLSTISAMHMLRSQSFSHPCPRLPSPLPPASPHSFLPSSFSLAKSQGCGHDRCEASLGLRQQGPPSGQLTLWLPVPPRPAPESRQVQEAPRLRWLWRWPSPRPSCSLTCSPAVRLRSLSLQEWGKVWFKRPTSRIPCTEKGRGIQIWKGNPRAQKQLGYFETK